MLLWSFPAVVCENKVSNAESLMPDGTGSQLGNPLQQNESNNEKGMNIENLLLE